MPFTAAAVERLGKKVVANIIAVRVLAQAMGDWVSAAGVEDAVTRRVPAKFRDLNLEALAARPNELGLEALKTLEKEAARRPSESAAAR